MTQEAYTNEFGTDKVVINNYIEKDILTALANVLGIDVKDVDYKTFAGLDHALQEILGTIADDINAEEADESSDIDSFGQAPGAGQRAQQNQSPQGQTSRQDQTAANTNEQPAQGEQPGGDQTKPVPQTSSNQEVPSGNQAGQQQSSNRPQEDSDQPPQEQPYDPYPDADTSDPGDQLKDQPNTEQLAEEQPSGPQQEPKENQPSHEEQSGPESDERKKKQLIEDKKRERSNKSQDTDKQNLAKKKEALTKDIAKANSVRWGLIGTALLGMDVLETIMTFASASLWEWIDWAFVPIIFPLIFIHLHRHGKIMRSLSRESRATGFMAGAIEIIPYISYLPANTAFFIVIRWRGRQKVTAAKKELRALERKERRFSARRRKRNT